MGSIVVPLRPLVLKVHHRPLLVPQLREVLRKDATVEAPVVETPTHLVGPSVMGVGSLPFKVEVDQVEAAIPDLPLASRCEEAGSLMVAVLAPLVPLAGGPHMLNDSLKADAWLELMKWHGTFDELVAFFYDSFAEMTVHAGEFFYHHQGIYDSYEVRIDRMSMKP